MRHQSHLNYQSHQKGGEAECPRDAGGGYSGHGRSWPPDRQQQMVRVIQRDWHSTSTTRCAAVAPTCQPCDSILRRGTPTAAWWPRRSTRMQTHPAAGLAVGNAPGIHMLWAHQLCHCARLPSRRLPHHIRQCCKMELGRRDVTRARLAQPRPSQAPGGLNQADLGM